MTGFELLQHTFFIGACLAIAAFAYRRGSLNGAAAGGAFVLSAGLYVAGGPLFLLLLMVFFFSSTALTRFKASIKDPIERLVHAKGGPRDLVQVAANGGAALIMVVLLALSGQQAFAVAAAGAFSACNADTWASEIGILSRRPPVSLLTFRPVRRGLSGGVSLLGFLASLAGAALISATYAAYRLATGHPAAMLWQPATLVLLAGLAGSVLDSLLGATLQAKYISHETGELTEKPCLNGQANRLHSGLRFVGNDFVNFASSLLAAALVLAFAQQPGGSL